MPLLYKRKTASTVLDIIRKPKGPSYKSNDTPFKTPLLSKFKLANFIKSKDEEVNEETPANNSADEPQRSIAMQVTQRSQSNIEMEDKLSLKNQESPTVTADNKQILETSLENQMFNQIVPSVSPVVNSEQMISPDIFGTSKSPSELTMNDPNIKEVYLDFLQKKNGSQPQSITTSQSSNFSFNDPPIKEMYIHFMENKDNMPKEENKKVNKPKRQSKIKARRIDEEQKCNQDKQNIRMSNRANKKRSKVTKETVCDIDIQFPRTTDSNKTLKKVRHEDKSLYRKKTVGNKLPVEKHLSDSKSNEKAKKEVDKLITSTLKFHTQKEKIEWVLESSNVGLYVICDRCEKTRYLKNVVDPLELPEKWYCENNSDPSQKSCSVPEIKIPAKVEEKLIENLYNTGSIVWGRLQGYPWWPAIVDVCPDTEDFFWLDNPEDQKPTWYNVTYFDTSSVTRSWLRVESIIPFRKYTNPNKQYNTKIPKELSYRLEKSIQMAHKALELQLIDRLQKYAFIYRYNKPINKHSEEKKKSVKGKKHRDKKNFRTKNQAKPKEIKRIASSASNDTTLSDILPFDLEPDVYPI